MGLIQELLMQQVKNTILNHADQQNTGFDPGALVNQLSGAASSGNFNASTVMDLIQNHADNQQHTGFDPGPLLSQVQGLFGQHQQEQQGGTSQYDNVKSSDDDPYGDPGQQQDGFANVKSSDEDPYGDPADEEQDSRK